MDSKSQNRIAIVGLGKMGLVIGSILIRGGLNISVWNRTANRAHELVEKGATVEDDIKNIVSENTLILITLNNYENIYEVFDGISDFKGADIINLTSGSPAEATELADRILGNNGNYLDGAMLAIPETLGTSHANLIFSGHRHIYDEHLEQLSLLGSTHYLSEKPDHAETYDMALLSASYAALSGFLNSTLIAETIDIRPSDHLKLLLPWLTSIVEFMPYLANEIEHQNYDDGVSNIDINHIAVENLIQTNKNRNIPTDLHLPLRNYLQRELDMGNGKKSFSAIYESIKIERKMMLEENKNKLNGI